MTLDLTTEQRAALPRNSKILVAMLEAKHRGEMAEADRLFSALDIPAHAFMASIPVRHLAGDSRANRLS